jgi:hypothetical protein
MPEYDRKCHSVSRRPRARDTWASYPGRMRSVCCALLNLVLQMPVFRHTFHETCNLCRASNISQNYIVFILLQVEDYFTYSIFCLFCYRRKVDLGYITARVRNKDEKFYFLCGWRRWSKKA